MKKTATRSRWWRLKAALNTTKIQTKRSYRMKRDEAAKMFIIIRSRRRNK